MSMAICRYKTLLSYLPGMATVVNSFQSAAVQQVVFEELLSALEVRMAQEGVAPRAEAGQPAAARGTLSASMAVTTSPMTGSVHTRAVNDNDIAHELLEGDSIHTAPLKG
jgi:hypothetical protein